MAPTPTAEKATATKKQQQHKASRADHSHANNKGKMVQSREGRSEPSSPEKAWSEQHAGHCKQQQRRQPCCSAFSITVLVLSILVVLVALGGPRAAKVSRCGNICPIDSSIKLLLVAAGHAAQMFHVQHCRGAVLLSCIDV